MSRLQRSLLQLLASALLLIVVYIVATPKDVPRSALLESSSFTSSSHKAPVEHLEKGARLQKRLSQKEYRTAQLLLAQLHRGRHQQKIRFPIHRPTPSPLARPRALQAAPSPVVVNTTTW